MGLPTGMILGLTDWVVPRMGPQGFWVGFIVGLTGAADAGGAAEVHLWPLREPGGLTPRFPGPSKGRHDAAQSSCSPANQQAAQELGKQSPSVHVPC